MNTPAVQCKDNLVTTAQYTSGTVYHPENTITAAVTPATAADETEKMVKQVICEKLGLEETQIKPGISFSDDLDIDSLDVFELMIEMENVFHITMIHKKTNQ